MLTAALLTEADLGYPYSRQPITHPTDTSSTSGCGQLQALNSSQSTSSQGLDADALFTAGTTGPFIEETLTAENSTDLSRDYTAAAAALNSCTDLTVTSSGTSISFQLTPITFPGPQSTARRMDGTYQGVAFNGYLVLEHIGDVAMTFTFLQVYDGSSQTAEAYFHQALTKIEQVLNLSHSPTAPA
ncbi:hypothetical protein ACEZDJ_08130 [Streptacidiphilus sp. N1-5]|uniref:Uncharacterized protein n=2 Tax=Streptomycetaceae TaxID=2062 RepID=A0ABV6UII3_9ACTN